MFAADAYIQHRSELGPSAVCQAVDRADDRLGESREMPRRTTANLATGGQLFGGRFDHLVNITTGRERPWSGAGQNNHADLIVVLDSLQLFIYLAGQLVAQSI